MPDVRRRALLLVVTAVLAPTLGAVLQLASPARAVRPTAQATAQPARATGSFFWANAWAAHHTAAHGPGSGAARMRRLVRLVRGSGVGLGALAELERSQITAFRRSAPSYRLLVGGRGTTNGIFWDSGAYDLVEGYAFRGLSYGGRPVRVPVAVLRDRATGDLLAVIAVHNPRDRWRDRALGRELQEVRRLRRAHGPVSVFLAGDFNAGTSVACRAHRARLFSVGNRGCRGSAPIDQLLADRSVRVRSYRRMTGARVGRITDHPAVYRARFAITETTSS
ncbi:hypothetical protein GCM10009798_00500 [Nocardioides panacihumi]|uniref:Endonuclease/exonuclease/phosphatase family protein n=1 Tax=Nocardioides panacihumi TaxID=400774 RepID=A0ABN2Q684_9ACTN